MAVFFRIMVSGEAGDIFFFDEEDADRIWAKKIPHTYHQRDPAP